MKKRKISSSIKRSLRKIKYLDKTQMRYFAIMSFLIGFCLFTGTTYSYFTFTRQLNAATISIAKLNYELTSADSNYNDSTITIPAGETITLKLDLKSLNSVQTKYALSYSSDSSNVKVYYSEISEQNVKGIIGSMNSIINITVVIENIGTTSANVTFTLDGGYLNNNLSSNIIEGYQEPVGALPEMVLALLNNESSSFIKSEIPDFSMIATDDETADGLLSLEDDYGTSYYFRGATSNNYVKFGVNANGEDMYWRIVRINGDCSLRVVYDGTQAWENGIENDNRYAIIAQPWNANEKDAKYVGWMFGGADGAISTSYTQATTNETDSDLKELLDTWYVENILNTGYSQYLSDEIFCNDRSLVSGVGYGSTTTLFGARERLVTNKVPTFICPEKNDAFTVDDVEKGNGALNYPIGLITADEIVAAGGVWAKSNSSYYLYKSVSYYGWSMSPGLKNDNYALVFYANTTGDLDYYSVNSTVAAAAPVINIASEYVIQLKGLGTQKSPYYLSL